MRIKPLLAINALSVVGNGCMAVQPIVVGAFVDRLGFSESQAGFVAAVEMAGVGVGLMFLVGLAHRLGLRRLACMGVATIAVANLLATLIHQFEYMLLAQFVVGLGSSMVFSVYLTIGASEERPEHLFAIVNAVSIAYSGVFLPVAPGILALGQLPGIFITLAVIAASASLLVQWLPTVPGRQATETPPPLAPARLLLNWRVVSVLLMMLLLYTGHGAVWAYQERIGVGVGMDVHRVGRWLGASMLFWGVLGSVLASRLGMRIGAIWPQVLSLGVSLIAAFLLVAGDTPVLFACASGLIALSWFYGLPYQMGLLAQYDRGGRLNLMGCMMTTGGAALGPALSAVLVGWKGHWTVGVLAGLCYMVGLVLVLPPSLERSRATVQVDARG
jgi:predicted MFS family arabinose efflux permease